MSTNRLAQLATIISSSATEIERSLRVAGLPSPTFGLESPKSVLDDSIQTSRQSLLEATEECHALMLGPVGLLTSHSHEIFITLQAIYRFKLATSFPEGKDEATFEQISERSGLPLNQVQRFMRHAATYHIFSEPRKGTIAHTAASKHLASDPLMQHWIGMVSEEMWPAACQTVEALTKWPLSEEPNHSGFNLAQQTSETVFGEFAKYPSRQARYASAMKWFSAGPGLEPSHIVHGFPWETLPQGGTVVDIGGSHGSVGIAIGRAHKSLQIVIQDRPEVVQDGKANVPHDIRDRVKFMAHDFFYEQPLRGADVYLLRWILHDWPDAYAIKILRAIIPALKLTSRVCICEHVLPEPGELSPYQERGLRSMDLAMLEFHNAKERDKDDWVHLLHRADRRFHIFNIRRPHGSRLSVIEVGWAQSQTCQEATAS